MEAATMASPLPDDALAAILRRLPPRTLAACRCVCKAWCAIVDARELLLKHLLPHAVRGIFVNYVDYRCPRFFARPSSERPEINGNLGFLHDGYSQSFGSVLDHCNGLLLYHGGFTREFFVVNPATRQWERLPPRMDVLDYVAHLVFDPAVSPHYEVFLIPCVPEKPRPVLPREVPPPPINLSCLFSLLDDEPDAEELEEDDEEEEEVIESPPPRSIEEGFFPARFTPESSEPQDPYRLMEWPPSPCTLHVFSSCAGRWEEKLFVQQGDAVGTAEDVRLDSLRPMDWGSRRRYGIYWRGALYLLNCFISRFVNIFTKSMLFCRLFLANCKFQVIKTPIGIEETNYVRAYLGQSKKGLYFATIHNHSEFRVWILDESCDQMEWILEHHVNLDPYASWPAVHSNYRERIDGPWILDGAKSDSNVMKSDDDLEWDSDEDNILDGDKLQCIDYILGFHPYKEIVFLMTSFTGIAYHLNSSKVQYLGKLRPNDYFYTHSAGLYESFLYTPCMIGELPETSQENHGDDQQHI
ncbi:hypothetical protein EJB05_07110, partial [Eragrostis curvula]